MRDKTLAQLYDEKPAAREILEGSAGYAVFSNTGVNVLVVSTASGEGVAHDNESGRESYMK
jgi:hypothetical protein